MTTTKQRVASVWDAIEDTRQGAASLRARSTLMMGLTEALKAQGLTQAQAAVLFGVTQPRISDLTRGKVALFSLDALVDMASTVGMNPTINVTMPKKQKAKADAGKASATPRPTSRKSKAAQVPPA